MSLDSFMPDDPAVRRAWLQANIAQVESLLASLHLAPISRVGFESRLEEIREELAKVESGTTVTAQALVENRHRRLAWLSLGLPENDAFERYVTGDPDDPIELAEDEARLPAVAQALANIEADAMRCWAVTRAITEARQEGREEGWDACARQARFSRRPSKPLLNANPFRKASSAKER